MRYPKPIRLLVSAPRESAAELRPVRTVRLDDFWDAFEPDVFGGPEAEPQPEPGDFCYEPDDWEEVWS